MAGHPAELRVSRNEAGTQHFEPPQTAAPLRSGPGPIATEMARPRRVRFYPDSGLTVETRTIPVEACWRFAAVFYAASYPSETS
jgi:hypothetical protein